MRQRSGSAHSRRRPLRNLLAATLLAGAALPVNAFADGVAVKPTSSCVACHTDSAKLQQEAKGLPVPAASALQSGKG